MASRNEYALVDMDAVVSALKSRAGELRDRLDAAEDDNRRLQEALHSLEVHETELEAMNEYMRRYQDELQRSEQSYRDLYELAPVAYMSLDRSGVICSINLTGSDLLGRERKRLLGHPLLPFVAPESRDAFSRHLRTVFRAGHGSAEIGLLTEERTITVECESRLVHTHDGDSQESRTAMRDISDRAETEHRRQLAEVVVDNMASGLMITDSGRRILSVNQAMCNMTGYCMEELVGKDPGILKSGYHDGAFYKELWAGVHEHGKWQGEIWNRLKDGTVVPQWTTLTTIKDRRGTITNYVALYADVSTQKHIRERLNYLAYYDVLTGLPNRRLLMDRLSMDHMHARRAKSRLAVLFIDIDHFKSINDTHGHVDADMLLRGVAERLRHAIRESDTVARIGGDEFVVALDNIGDREQAAVIVEKIRAVVSRPIPAGGQELRITVSIGISMFPEDGGGPEELMRTADAAMYAAKQAGRNQARFYERSGSGQEPH